jgi:hypothetical protein
MNRPNRKINARQRRVMRLAAVGFGIFFGLCLMLYATWKTIHPLWLAHREPVTQRQTFRPAMATSWRKMDWREALNAEPAFLAPALPWFDPRLPPVHEPKDFPYQRGAVGNSWFKYSPMDPGSLLPSTRFKWKRGLSITGSDSEPMIGWHGTLHSHTGWSDGSATPAEAFAFARDIGGLDFFAVTDHPESWFFNPGRNWETLQKNAESAGGANFVALAGFEYSSPIFGHYIVIGSDGVCSAVKCPDLNDFYEWLLRPENKHALVAFAHPLVQRDNAGRFEFRKMQYLPALQKQMFGMEVIHWSGHDQFMFGFSGKKPFIDEALAMGWLPGPLGSQDNHGPNWGLANSRIGILTKALDRESLMEALRSRRFYATSSRDLELSFEIRMPGQPWVQMGGTIATPKPRLDSKHQTSKDTQLETRLRLFEPDEYNAPRRIEWILDGQIVGRLDFENLPHELSSRALEENYYSGEILGSLPESMLNDGQQHYIYVRMFMANDFATYAQSSPIIFTP